MQRQLLSMILLLLAAMGQGVRAQEPYAVLSSDKTTLTFYDDDQKAARGGMSVGPFSGLPNGNLPDWHDQCVYIKTVVFDDSFEACASIISTAYWFYECIYLTSIVGLEKLNTANVTDMSLMFYNCESLTSLDVSHFNTAKVTSMHHMFCGCKGLTSLDVSHFNTAKVTDMHCMFCYCKGLTSLDLSSFNTANVTRMSQMFYYCDGLTSLDVSNFNTANVTYMDHMFAGCSSLTSLDISNFNTAKVANISGLFENCYKVTMLDVSNFNTANVTDMGSMFQGCRELTSLDLSGFNTANVTNMGELFWGCSRLTYLDMSNFNTDKVTIMSSMFRDCSALTTIYCNDTWSCSNSYKMFKGSTNLKGAIAYDENKTDVTYANPNTGYFTKTDGTSETQSTGTAVDLGLSVYWASCNVGASSPEDIGGYYAWGETKEKDLYGYNYAYSDSETSFQDIGTDISGTQYDVARAKWGGSWRMPTLAECKELLNNCTWTWTSLGGVNGALVKGTNGNSIFLPAGGRKYGDKGLRDLGEYGCYWSSTVSSNTGTNSSAEFLLLYNRGKATEGRNRINGMTIRPVTTEATSIISVGTANSKDQRVYNLGGQQLTAPQKGINIIDGRKVVVK